MKNIFARPALIKFGEAIACVALGVMLAVFVAGLRKFNFDWSVSAVSVLTLMMTVVLTFLLQNTLNRRESDDRIEKAMFIDQTKKIGQRLDRIAQLCRESALGEVSDSEARTVLTDFKALNAELYTLEKLLELTPIELDLSRVREIVEDCRELKQVATGGVFPSSALSPEENSKVQTLASTISAKIYRLIFYINRL